MWKKKKSHQEHPAPVRRNTMDVDTSWLIRSEPPPVSDKQPPPLAGPTRRETIEVEMDWLEEPAAAHPSVPPVVRAKPRGKLPPPLPREEPLSDPKTAATKPHSRRGRAAARDPSDPSDPPQRPRSRAKER
jgi:hypothetical protein